MKPVHRILVTSGAALGVVLLIAPIVFTVEGCAGATGNTFIDGIGQSRIEMGKKLAGAWETSAKTQSGHHVYIEFVHYQGALRGRAWFHTGDRSHPVGEARIKDVVYDSTNGRISFEFSSPTGPFASLSFVGTLSKNGLQGTLSSTSRSRGPFVTETVTFFGQTTTVTVPNFALPTGLPFSGVILPQGPLDQNNNPIAPATPCTESNAVVWPPCGQYVPFMDWYGSNSILLFGSGGGHFALFFFQTSFNITSLSGDTAHACFGGCSFTGTATMTPQYFGTHNGDTGWMHSVTAFGMDGNLSFAGPGPNNGGTISGTIGTQQYGGQTYTSSISGGLVNLPVTFTIQQNFNTNALIGTNTAFETVSFTGSATVSPQLVANPMQIVGSFTAVDSSDAVIGGATINWYGSNIGFSN